MNYLWLLGLMAAYFLWNGIYGLTLPDKWCKSRFTAKRGLEEFGADPIFFARTMGFVSLLMCGGALAILVQIAKSHK